MKYVHVRAYDKKDEKVLNSKEFKSHVEAHGGKASSITDKGVEFEFHDSDRARRFHMKNIQHYKLGSDLYESAPTNAAGGGGIAGIGVGNEGEPPVRKKKSNYTKQNEQDTEKMKRGILSFKKFSKGD